MGERRLRIAMLVVRKAREQMQALFGAGGGYIQEARGLGVLGVGVEVLEVLVGEVLVGAGFLDGGQKQPPRTPLARGANTSFHRNSGGSLRPGPRSRPGTMTVSNSRPLALWMVMICRSSSPAATSGSA